MPGRVGKSVVIASIVKDALTSWPKTRVLMLVHSRELVAQNAAKLRAIWPGAPMGVYSASLGKRQLGEPITYAGIQSVRNLAKNKKSAILTCACATRRTQSQHGNRHLPQVFGRPSFGD